MSFVTDLLAGMVLPALAEKGKPWVINKLQEFHDENPELYASLMTAVYPFVDVYLERAVLASKTKLDNVPVAALKEVLEESAAANGVSLPNLDAGQAGD